MWMVLVSSVPWMTMNQQILIEIVLRAGDHEDMKMNIMICTVTPMSLNPG